MNETRETWVSFPDFEGSYEVSSRGRVRSLDRYLSNGQFRKGQLLKPQCTRRSVAQAYLCVENIHYRISLARTVLSAFDRKPKDGEQAFHHDGDKRNCSIENLTWVNAEEASRAPIVRGTHGNVIKTLCPRGHELTGQNLRKFQFERYGKRQCRQCESLRRSSPLAKREKRRDWAEVLRAVRSANGRWVLVAEDMNRTVVGKIKNGILGDSQKGEFDARAEGVTQAGKAARVYARLMNAGENE